ncbi:RusA family crossover junction endodeoxyribonuclease [Microbacterium gilvum]|uniref:Uncharacterized protein n=1 Tax=Microbacterium gilvum TaxID=1336204 RepID=A0ABP9A5V7_9MICO
MFETTIVFGWKRPPLTANQRLHWAERAQLTRMVRTAAMMTAPLETFEKVAVKLTWVVKDNRRRDADNIYPTFKALCDGLVDGGVVPDDTPQYMDKLAPFIRLEKDADPHFELLIREVAS